MTKKHILAFTILGTVAIAGWAVSVPNSFTAQTAARAAEVNANFTALANAVTTLEAKVATLEGKFAPPTMASLAGTYDLIEHRVDVDVQTPGTSHAIASSGVSGTIILAADGTGSGTTTGTYRQLTFNESNRPISNDNSTTSDDIVVKETDVGFNNPAESDSFSFTWTLTGGRVVIAADNDVSFIVASDRILFHLDRSDDVGAEGQDGLSVLIRR